MNDEAIIRDMGFQATKSAHANEHLIGLPPTDLRIAELIHRNEFVVTMWTYDDGEHNRVGILPIKWPEGDGMIYITCTAIPCTDEAAARKLVELYSNVAPSSKRSH